LGELLKARDVIFDILSRGYGRQTRGVALVDPAGSARDFGDEPLLLARRLKIPVVVGEDRYEAGVFAENKFGPQLHLLDDGFQHRRLDRTIDIVLIDALDPWGGGRVFPLGRLREPPAGLARADIFLITRADLTDLAASIEHDLRRWNARAPIFRARLEPQAWIDSRTGTLHPLAQPPFGPVAAFCGLGNPASFRRTLESLHVPLVDWLEFHDHHRYRPRELRHIVAQARAKGASALLTTAKDAVNLCEGAEDLLAPLPLYCLDVTLAIEEEQTFLHELWTRLNHHI
jgi:tetraacyldisaccharide 4'-kinase